MQMVKKIIVTLLLLWFALLAFMPKEQLYFGLERELVKQGIEINEKSIDEGIFDLVLHDVSIYVKGVKIATAKQVSFFTLFVYNKVKIDLLHTDKGLKSILSLYLEKTVWHYSIVDPMHIYFRARGDIGVLKGFISLKKRKAYIDFEDPKKANKIKRYLKKDQKGWYYAF